VIVLSGTMYVGFGDQFDEGKLLALPPGSFSRSRATCRMTTGRRTTRWSSRWPARDRVRRCRSEGSASATAAQLFAGPQGRWNVRFTVV